MLYLLIEQWRQSLEAGGLGFLRVFTFATFQSACAFILSFIICLAMGKPLIRFLVARKIGDAAKHDEPMVNAVMAGKGGTPTMGGVMMIAAIVVSTLIFGDISNFYLQMGLICLVWLGAVGAIDDWLKLLAERARLEAKAAGKPEPENVRQGLFTAEKFLAQIGLAVVLCWFTYRHGADIETTRAFFVPFFKDVAIPLSMCAFIVIGTLVISGTSNAVNLTDGMDGLAAGCLAIAGFCFVVLSIIAGSADSERLFMPYVQNADQMAVLAASLTGACLGFMWFNCHPASVFMGDTGALALGGLLGYIAIVIRQELLLVVIGGVFVMEAMSVILQVGWFKITKWRYGAGRRIFRMSPIHLHFRQLGWPETKVVVRFWLIAIILGALSLASIKLR